MVETTTTDASASSKKQKTFPMSPDEEWPEAWLMPAAESTSSDDDNAFDQCAENRCEPNVPVTPAELKKLGIYYWKMPDVDVYKVCMYVCMYVANSILVCVCGVGFVIITPVEDPDPWNRSK